MYVCWQKTLLCVSPFNTRHYSIIHVHVYMIASAGYTVVLCVILMFLISNYLYM